MRSLETRCHTLPNRLTDRATQLLRSRSGALVTQSKALHCIVVFNPELSGKVKSLSLSLAVLGNVLLANFGIKAGGGCMQGEPKTNFLLIL